MLVVVNQVLPWKTGRLPAWARVGQGIFFFGWTVGAVAGGQGRSGTAGET